MKHCILAKYRPEVYPCRQELLPRIRQIFSAASELEGVSGASVYPNCVARDNRYDVLIVLDMAPGSTAGVRRIGYAPPLEGGVRPAAGAEGHL